MLDELFGGKNIKKILLFLFVNGKCYGSQLHRMLQTPLTPLQKALLRLEKGGVIMSYYEGKTRVYQFSPSYPLLDELQHLLKKGYTLLSPQEKKSYYASQEDKVRSQDYHEQRQLLRVFWEQLSQVGQLSFQAKTFSKDETGWNGRGRGVVTVCAENETTLVFHEKGSWKGKEGKETDFSNVFRWTLDLNLGMISLEHLRRGANHPVFLFHLAPTNQSTLSSIDSHLCEGDTYFGKIYFDRHSLRLNWRVIGPKKNEEIDCHYN